MLHTPALILLVHKLKTFLEIFKFHVKRKLGTGLIVLSCVHMTICVLFYTFVTPVCVHGMAVTILLRLFVHISHSPTRTVPSVMDLYIHNNYKQMKINRLGAVAHAYNPSTLGDQGGQMT